MPAQSKAQQALFAIARYKPGALNAENKGLAKLPASTLDEFARTPTKDLPEHAAKPKPKLRIRAGGR